LAALKNGMLSIRDTETGLIRTEGRLPGAWTPRATRGDQVALVQGSLDPRSSTTLLVMRAGSERKRFELPGNVEPEAFSVDGDGLFVLDYLPPTAPDGYRVRWLDLTTSELTPLLTQLKQVVPPGAEEVMRGQGRRAVLDPDRSMLFTLYTHGGDHRHTGNLLGVRPDAPNVHAFIHSLHLSQNWAVCIDLPAPFGFTDPAGHTVAMSADNKTPLRDLGRVGRGGQGGSGSAFDHRHVEHRPGQGRRGGARPAGWEVARRRGPAAQPRRERRSCGVVAGLRGARARLGPTASGRGTRVERPLWTSRAARSCRE
jgi:hypothetical protein